MPDISRRPRKQPRQARSQATVGVILDATALLLVDEGYEQTTTNRIAERAGVSIGSLYQYFPNRDALIAALAHRTESQISETIWRAMSNVGGLDLRSIVSFGVNTAVSSRVSTLPLSRVLLGVVSRPVAVQWPPAAFPQRQAILRGIFNSRAGELRPGLDLEAASFFIPRMVGSAIDAAIVARPEAFANGELARELTTMLTYYLIGEQ